jgi:hypothetical protein
MGGKLVLDPVPREERHAPPADLAQGDRRRRVPERGVDVDLLDVLQERVETRSAEDADLRAFAQADFPLAWPEAFFSFVPVPVFFESPPEPELVSEVEGFEGRLSVR